MSQPDPRLSRHVVWLTAQLEAGAEPDHLFRDSIIDGPVPGDEELRWHGASCRLPPAAWSLFALLWNRGPMAVADVESELWGRAPPRALASARAKVNAACERIGAPWRVRVCGRRVFLEDIDTRAEIGALGYAAQPYHR